MQSRYGKTATVHNHDGQPIKIGYTNKPAKYVDERISGIQNGNPKRLEILCLIDGSLAKEKRIHNTFDSIRLSGEWFLDKPQLIEYIRYLQKNHFDITDF